MRLQWVHSREERLEQILAGMKQASVELGFTGAQKCESVWGQGVTFQVESEACARARQGSGGVANRLTGSGMRLMRTEGDWGGSQDWRGRRGSPQA